MTKPNQAPLRRAGAVAAISAAACLLPVPTLLAQTAPQPRPQAWSGIDPEWVRGYEGIRIYSKPSRDAAMGFSFPNEIRQILARGGERVTKGDVLVRGRDREAEVAVNIQERRARLRLEIDAATLRRDLAKIEFDNLTQARQQGGGGGRHEVERARIAYETSEVELAAAAERYEEQQLILERMKADLERYRLLAPFDGVVESVKVDVGQIVREAEVVIRVVNVDSFWLDVPTPTHKMMSLGLKPGDPAWVVLDTPETPNVYTGRVLEVSPVADFAAQSVMVKVEVANPDGRPAGLAAWVRFEEPQGDWAERVANTGTAAQGGDGR